MHAHCDIYTIEAGCALPNNLVKTKIKEYALDMLNESKFKHSKMDGLIYTSEHERLPGIRIHIFR